MADNANRKTGTIAMIGAALLLVLTLVLMVMQSTEREEIPSPNAPEARTPVVPETEVAPNVTEPPATRPPDPKQPERTQ